MNDGIRWHTHGCFAFHCKPRTALLERGIQELTKQMGVHRPPPPPIPISGAARQLPAARPPLRRHRCRHPSSGRRRAAPRAAGRGGRPQPRHDAQLLPHPAQHPPRLPRRPLRGREGAGELCCWGRAGVGVKDDWRLGGRGQSGKSREVGSREVGGCGRLWPHQAKLPDFTIGSGWATAQPTASQPPVDDRRGWAGRPGPRPNELLPTIG